MRIVSWSERDVLPSAAYPRHVGIIMDGNRRWAQARGLAAANAHDNSCSALRSCIIEARRHAIAYFTIFCLSTENWRREPEEVQALLRLSNWLWPPDVIDALEQTCSRVQLAGDVDDERLVRAEFEPVKTLQSRRDSKMVVTFAVNYGSRAELTWAASQARGRRPNNLESHFYCPELPDLDLVIRTGGEIRLSNFMLWQAAYAELVFTDTLWPDFTGLHLVSAAHEYAMRRRRSGQ